MALVEGRANQFGRNSTFDLARLDVMTREMVLPRQRYLCR